MKLINQGPSKINLYGYTFLTGVPVEVTSESLINKFKGYGFVVDGDAPKAAAKAEAVSETVSEAVKEPEVVKEEKPVIRRGRPPKNGYGY